MLVQAYGAHAGDKPLEPLQIIRHADADQQRENFKSNLK